MNLIKSCFFNFMIMVIPLLIAMLFFPLMIFKSLRKKIAVFVGSTWVKYVKFMLKLVYNITVEIRGSKHIPKRAPFIIAAKHQSALDTLVIFEYFNGPLFVLKKSLLKIPVFGQYVRAIGMLPIDRTEGIKSLKNLILSFSEALKNNNTVVIFPEGTRTLPMEDSRIKPGIAAIHQANPDIPILPVATNSGLYWPKSGPKKTGIVVFEFLPTIKTHMQKRELIKSLEEKLNQSSNKLCKN